MIVLLSLLLFFAGWAIYIWRFKREIYRRYPWGSFALFALAIPCATYAVARSGSGRSIAALSLEVSVTAVFAWYIFVYSYTPKKVVTARVGQRMPDITLPTSAGTTFSSRELLGRQAALYVFYRGDW